MEMKNNMAESFIHTRRLAQFLEMEAMGASELKKTVETKVPRELSYHDYDGKIVNARELLISEGIQGSTLIPTEIAATVIEGSEPVRCMREVLPVLQMRTPSMAVPYGETGTYAPVVAEGAEIPVEDQTYGSVTLTARKYAVRPLITNEMVDDALFDIIAMEIRKGGYRLENALNKYALGEILDAHGNTSAAATTTPLLMAAKCQAEIIGDGFTPDKLVMCPGFYGASMAEGMVFGNQMGADLTRSGSLGNILGMDSRICGIAYASTVGSHVWRYTTNADVGAFMFDSNSAGVIGMRQDIRVEQYADSIRQMQGVSLSMRFDVQAMIADAIGVVIY
jgi:hypothetical protein